MLKHIFILLTVLMAGCVSDKDCSEESSRLGGRLPFSFGEEWPPYIFELPMNIYPLKDTSVVGDTIWLNVDFNDSLVDLLTNKKYKIANLPIKFDFSLTKLDSQSSAPFSHRSNNKFDIYIKKNKTQSPIFCEYSNNKYTLNIGLIPKEKGVFLFDISDLEFQRLPFKGSCSLRTKRGVNGKWRIKNQKTNYEIFQNNLGSMWHIKPSDIDSHPYNFSVWHDSIKRNKEPGPLVFNYCFVVMDK